MTLEQARQHMRETVFKSGRKYRDWAADAKVSPQFLSAVVNGRKSPSKRVLTVFGLERDRVYITYREIK